MKNTLPEGLKKDLDPKHTDPFAPEMLLDPPSYSTTLRLSMREEN